MRYYKHHTAQFFGGSRPVWAGPFFDAADDGGGGGQGEGGGDGEGNADSAEQGAGGEGTEGEKDKKPGKGEPEGDAGKPGDKGKPDGDPEVLTPESFTLPKGYKFREDDAKTFTDILSDKALSEKDRAQKFIDLHCKVLGDLLSGIDAGSKAEAEAQAKRDADEEAGWLDACKADPDIGGHNWERSQARMERVVRELKLEPLHAMMVEAGTQNHPDYFKTIVGLHALIGEDKAGGGKASSARKSDVDVFYPDRGED